MREWVREVKPGSNVIIEYQPLVALGESARALYSVHAKLRDQRAPLGGVGRAEYLRIAQEIDAMVMIDRMTVFNALAELEKERARGRAARLMLHIVYATLEGSARQWLEAVLRRRVALVDAIIIELDCAAIQHDAHAKVRLARLHALGVRICVADTSGSFYHLRTWCTLPIDMLLVTHAVLETKSNDALCASLQRWRALGRQVAVDAVEDASAVARLLECGVDYARGDALAAHGLRLDYDADRAG
ncbi:MAG: EAL domain-containing protein [Dokdonella sp.]